jgi:uncharacterized phage protein (TIGR01671 family)
MREILFRGKRDKEYGEGWVYGVPYIDYAGDTVMKNDCSERVVYRETVGQYTGLKDRKGNPIFEGDVLRYYSDYLNEYAGSPCQVCYGEFNCSCCDGVYGWYFKDGDIRYHEDYEVIGNIHDNPELMEVQHE